MPSNEIEMFTKSVTTQPGTCPGDPVQQLRRVGIRVWAKHQRNPLFCQCDGQLKIVGVSLYGGSTAVCLDEVDGNGYCLATGEATCRPDERFNRKLGFRIALGRALKELRDRAPEFPEIGGSGG